MGIDEWLYVSKAAWREVHLPDTILRCYLGEKCHIRRRSSGNECLLEFSAQPVVISTKLAILRDIYAVPTHDIP